MLCTLFIMKSRLDRRPPAFWYCVVLPTVTLTSYNFTELRIIFLIKQKAAQGCPARLRGTPNASLWRIARRFLIIPNISIFNKNIPYLKRHAVSELMGNKRSKLFRLWTNFPSLLNCTYLVLADINPAGNTDLVPQPEYTYTRNSLETWFQTLRIFI